MALGRLWDAMSTLPTLLAVSSLGGKGVTGASETV